MQGFALQDDEIHVWSAGLTDNEGLARDLIGLLDRNERARRTSFSCPGIGRGSSSHMLFCGRYLRAIQNVMPGA
jgi:hypothetical protein